MSDPNNPPVKAEAQTYKIPSQSTIDNLRDELAGLQMKLGKAQGKAILSSAQARADKHALDEIQKNAEAKRLELEEMVELFTAPITSDPGAALKAIRERLAPKVEVHVTAPVRPLTLEDLEKVGALFTGGQVKPGSAYLVGENTGEAIVPAAKPLTAADLDEIKGKGEVADQDDPGGQKGFTVSGQIAPASFDPKRLEDPDHLDGFTYGVKAVVVEKIENAQPGDVLVADDLEAARSRNAFRGKRPPKDPSPGDRWIYPTAAGGPTVEYDASMGWVIVADKGEITEHTRKAVAADFTSDFWEAGEIDAALNHPPRHKRGLFERG